MSCAECEEAIHQRALLLFPAVYTTWEALNDGKYTDAAANVCYDKFSVSDTYWSQGSPSIFMVTAFGDMGLDNAVNICQLPPHPHCITLKKMAALFIWTSTGWLLCEYEFIKKKHLCNRWNLFMCVSFYVCNLASCSFVRSFVWICVFIYVNLSGWRFSFWAYVCVGVCLSAFSLIHLIRFLLIHSLYLWKKVLCFSPHHSVCLCVCLCVCVSVCLSVCHHVRGEMAGLSNMVSSEVNTIYKNLKMQY